MTPSQLVNGDLLAGLLGALVFFVAGVAFAAYRAVGWVETMRRWAYSVEVETEGDRDG